MAAPTDAGEDLRRAGVPEISADDPVFYRRPIDTFDAEGYFVSRQVRPLTARTLTSLFVRVRREAGSVGPSVTASSIRHLSARLVHQAARADATRVTGLDGGSDESRRLLETTWLAAVKRSLFTAHE
ncbi:hypothetical protein [Geodermatophilus sabuli]|uniref:hypothetical protein n=1 Tax=Geodermatophilus sabuli TaxID=1564158 RepID=UPI000BE269F3|nr:hypothetical protein [Geodermatophilus sabuli]MBB3084203.1 hypothetical protein [Geodermatophilus sabuli]